MTVTATIIPHLLLTRRKLQREFDVLTVTTRKTNIFDDE